MYRGYYQVNIKRVVTNVYSLSCTIEKPCYFVRIPRTTGQIAEHIL